MAIQTLKIFGSALLKPSQFKDSRGCFLSYIGQDILGRLGVDFQFMQMNGSLSTATHTLRGLHMQRSPATETKIIRVLSGALWDVIVDLRPESPSYKQWLGLELRAEDRQVLVIPPGCAHGFLTLRPHTEMMYMVDKTYAPEHELVIRWNDPSLGIKWPHPPKVISPKDKSAPDFQWTTI
ncbi:MAG: dTDP-4-dehydrorhamnose 3,5-epimerase [Myxococcota bacterium]